MKTLEQMAKEAFLGITKYGLVKSGRSTSKAQTLELGELALFAKFVRAEAMEEAAYIADQLWTRAGTADEAADAIREAIK